VVPQGTPINEKMKRNMQINNPFIEALQHREKQIIEMKLKNSKQSFASTASRQTTHLKEKRYRSP